jgi:hypothetical protein
MMIRLYFKTKTTKFWGVTFEGGGGGGGVVRGIRAPRYPLVW